MNIFARYSFYDQNCLWESCTDNTNDNDDTDDNNNDNDANDT